MIKTFISTAVIIVSTAIFTFAQMQTPTPTPQPAPTPVNLETILTEAEEQTANYRETFRDLLATETKTFERYDKKGELKERTVIESNFLVYQSSKDGSSASELRNIIKKDDKLVPDSQARADRFLAELAKTTTLEKELERIQQEGSRYDKTLEISGFTLYEGIALSSNLRSVFDFKLLGSENYQGNEVYVLSYQQTKKTPLITVNEKASNNKDIRAEFDADIPSALKNNDIFLSGKLWIDKQTFQIWREERRLIVQTPIPLVALETILEYNQSEFGILVPKKITFVENGIKKNSKGDQYTTVKNSSVNFDYSKFKKTNVEVQIIDEP